MGLVHGVFQDGATGPYGPRSERDGHPRLVAPDGERFLQTLLNANEARPWRTRRAIRVSKLKFEIFEYRDKQPLTSLSRTRLIWRTATVGVQRRYAEQSSNLL